MKNTKEIQMPHDRGYKRDLSNPEEFLHFLQKYIGADWTKEINSSQLQLCDKEFVEKDYEGKEADLIYRIAKENGRQIVVFVLQELQSTIDYTMIFRILVYVVNILVRFFMAAAREEREKKDFRLPAVVPIVFYNGTSKWNAVENLREYQINGSMFGEYVLNLQYYLIDLSQVEEEYILSTNSVIDNIMYCDKFRKNAELEQVVRKALTRASSLKKQEAEEFVNWVRNILLAICGNKKEMVQEILSGMEKGEDDVAFKYNIIRAFEEEREEGKIEGKIEGKKEAVFELLEEMGKVPDSVRRKIEEASDYEVLRFFLKMAAKVNSIDEFEGLVAAGVKQR